MSHSLHETLTIREVSLTEDRGTIRRSKLVRWPGGAGTLVVEGVSPLLVNDSLRVAVDTGEVGKVTVHRDWVRADLSELEEAAKLQQQALLLRKGDTKNQQKHIQRAAHLLQQYTQSISASASANRGSVEQWASDVSALHARHMARVESLCAAMQDQEDAQKHADQLSESLASLRGQWTLNARVEIALEAEAGPVTVLMHYLVPSAMWRPSYQAALDTERSTLTLTAQATLWQRTGEDWPAVPITLSTARPSAGATLPKLHHDPLSSREKSTQERRTIQVQSWDQSIQRASLSEDEGLPGVDDGGETQQLTTAQPLAVPSSGRPHRARVSEASTPATVQYRCVPEQSPHVFRVVSLQNPLPHPLLTGPVTLVMEGGPCGTGKIPFVAPGEPFVLSFGSEDEVSVVYQKRVDVEERFAMEDHRWFVQDVYLSNTGAETRSIELILRTPISELEQVNIVVDTGKRSSQDMEGPDDQGFVRWQVTLAPRAAVRRQVSFRVEKGRNVQLADFW